MRSSRAAVMALVLCALVACAPGNAVREPPLARLPQFWEQPAPPDEPARLALEPRVSVARLGDAVVLTLHGSSAADASCSRPREGFALAIASPSEPSVVEIECSSGVLSARAQVTFTDAVDLHVADPYAGGVVLFKLRRTPPVPLQARGRRALGFRSLERTLTALGAWAMAAFPVDRRELRDSAGLARWMAVDIPKKVNFYQAVSLLRAEPDVHPESYLPEDAAFIRIRSSRGWPAAITPARSAEVADKPHKAPVVPRAHTVAHVAERSLDAVRPGWAVRGVGAPEVWDRVRGRGIGIAIVDTGVDLNHRIVIGSVRDKQSERGTDDGDGNGIPGDARGANFAHIAIAHGYGPPGLAVGQVSNVTDWAGVADRPSRSWGHGTAIAAIAAGADPLGAFVGVAPQAWILPVDVQENLRAPAHDAASDDPRTRILPARRSARRAMEPLRRSIWSQAMGVAYAVSEEARVLTCAWPAQLPHWITLDALRFAEENCTLAVCAVSAPAGDASRDMSFPAEWRTRSTVLDVWTGELRDDLAAGPLRALIVAGLAGDTTRPQADLFAPDPPRRGSGIAAPVSNPRNDQVPLLDSRIASFEIPGIAAGLVAGTAALILERRSDLDPHTLKDVLVGAAGLSHAVFAPDALDTARHLPVGSCAPGSRDPRTPRAGEPWWKRAKIRGGYGSPSGQTIPLPGSSEPEEE